MWNVELRPCISFAIVLYHCSAPAPASGFDAAGKTGSAAPALEIQSLVRTPSNRAIGCGELFLCEWTVVKQPFIRTTPNLNKSTGHPESRRAALAEKAKKNKSEAEASLMKK